MPTTRALWLILLPATAAVISFAFTCITPFAAYGAIAGLCLKRRDAALAMALVWFANQGVGFVFRDYPHDASTLAWGGVLLLGALGSAAAAGLGRNPAPAAGTLARGTLRAALAITAAYLTVQGVIFVAGLFLGGDAFSPSLQLDLVALNGATFIGLLGIAGALWAASPRSAPQRVRPAPPRIRNSTVPAPAAPAPAAPRYPHVIPFPVRTHTTGAQRH